MSIAIDLHSQSFLTKIKYMKKTVLIAMFLMSAFLSNAQIDFANTRIELAGNYTMYKGDFQQNTPGAKLRIAVPASEKITLGLGFTYGFPIKYASSVSLDPSGEAASELVFKFKTISFDASYFFGGEKENGFNVYGQVGAGLILVNYEEQLKGSVPPGSSPIDQVEKTNENGFTINLGLGGQYSFGRPKIFGEAQLALPANQVNGAYVENVIPAHIIFNVGVRFSLGQGSDY